MSETPPDSASPGSSGDNPWASPTSDAVQDNPATQPLPAPSPPAPPPAPDFGPAPAYGAPPAPTYGQQPGYPQPYPAAGQVAPGVPTASSATTVLVLGVASVALTVFCGIGFIPAIIALVLSGNARREVLASGGALGGLSQIRTGKICSWVSIGLTVLAVLVAILFISFFAVIREAPDSSY